MSLTAKLLSPFTRALPIYSGCNTLANGKLPEPPKLDSETPLRLRDGSLIYADTADYIGRSIYYFGDLDPKINWLGKKFLRSGDTVLDIGANLGVFALPASQLVGESGRVIAFEPQPDIADLLARSIQKNGYQNIHLQRVALGANNEELQLQIPSGNAGGASLIEEYSDAQSVSVEVRNAAELLQELEATDIRLVKMDVEGFEETVLEAAAPLWEKNPPSVIVFEYRQDIPYQESGIAPLLESWDYQIYRQASHLLTPTLVPIEAAQLAEKNGERFSHDYVALQPEVR